MDRFTCTFVQKHSFQWFTSSPPTQLQALFQGRLHEFHPELDVSSTVAPQSWQSLQCKLCLYKRMLDKNKRQGSFQRTVAEKALCHRNIDLLRLQATGWIPLFLNFHKSSPPIRLNRSLARSMHETIRPSSWTMGKPCLCQNWIQQPYANPSQWPWNQSQKQQLQSGTSTVGWVICTPARQIQYPSPISQLTHHVTSSSQYLSNISPIHSNKGSPVSSAK